MPVIEVEGLRKRYGDTVAVDDVSFTVEEGEIFGILGPNGAGKTTTVECIEGLRTHPTADPSRYWAWTRSATAPCGSASACSCRRVAMTTLAGGHTGG